MFCEVKMRTARGHPGPEGIAVRWDLLAERFDPAREQRLEVWLGGFLGDGGDLNLGESGFF